MRGLAAALLLALLVALVFGSAAGHEFVTYDDDLYVTANDEVQAGLSLEGARWALRTSHTGNWHPLTWLSHMLDVELFGLDAGAHHLTSVVLHGLSAILLLLALRALTLERWPAFAIAALFAVHPLRVESVAWVSERKDVLSGLFFHLTLLAWAGYAWRGGAARYAAVVLALALGLLAKSMLVTAPLVLLLLDVWPLRRWTGVRAPGAPGPERARRAGALVLEKLPLLALAAGSAWMTVRHQGAEGAIAAVSSLPWDARISNAALAVVAYVTRFFWPTGLAAFYPHPALVDPDYAPWSPAALAALAAVGGVTLVALVLVRRRPWVTVGWAWTLGMLVPVLGLVQVGDQAMADRYAYLPLTGLALLVVAQSWRAVRSRPRLRAGWIALVLVALAGCVLVARRQVATWRDSRTLFEHADAVTERNAMAHLQIGSALANEGDLDAARARFEEVLAIQPDHAIARGYLAAVLARAGEPEAALREARASTALAPRQPDVQALAARLLAQLGRGAEARETLVQARRLLPGDADLAYQLGVTLDRAGDVTGAEREYRAALELDPRHADAWVALAGVAARAGRLDDAEAALDRALAVDPAHTTALARRGRLHQMRGELPEAVALLRRAVGGEPFPLAAAARLARILATCDDDELRAGDEAVRLAERCLAEPGGDAPVFLDTLAAAYAEVGRFEDAIRLQTEALARVAPAQRGAFEERLARYRTGRPAREPAGR